MIFLHTAPTTVRILTTKRQSPFQRRGFMEKLAIGMLIGAVGGALVVANSQKMRTLVQKGQDELLTKVNIMMDEKLDNMQKQS